MKSNGLASILNALLVLGLLASLILCAQYVYQSRAYRADSGKAAGIREWQNILRAFAADCVAYSKEHPDIVPILETVSWTGAKPAASAAPAKPTTK